MRIKAGTLSVDITADGKDFESTLKRDDNLSEAFASNVQRRMKRASGAFKSLGEAAGLTDRELANFEKRMRAGLATDSASRALENLRRYAGLSTNEYKNLAAQLGVTTRESSKAGVALGTLAQRAIAAATAFVSFRAAAMAAADAFGTFSTYESALTDMAKVTDQSLSSINDAMMAMPRNLGAPTELVKGYYQTISAGVTDTTEAMDLLTTAAKASKAAHVDQSEVIKALTKTMAGFDGELKTATNASDLLFKMEKLGQTSFAELVPVIGDVAQTTHLVGVKFEEMAAGMALITQTSGSTAEASTKWKAIMIGLYKPTENMQKVLKALGYESGQAMVKQLGFAGSLETLKATAEKSHFSLGKLFESSEALTGVAALGAKDWSRYAGMLDEVRSGAGETERAFSRFAATSQSASDEFKATWEEVSIYFGKELAPAVSAGLHDVATVLKDPSVVEAMKSWALNLGNIVSALAEIAKYASLRSVTGTFTEGARLAGQGYIELDAFIHSSFVQRQQMVDAALAREKQALSGAIPLQSTHADVALSSSHAAVPDTAKVQQARKAVQGLTVDLDGNKKASDAAANAAERYGERTAAALEQAQDQYDQLLAQYNGDSLGAKLAAIDKKYDKAASAIWQTMIGAKGATDKLNKALTVTEQSRALEKLIAQADAWKKSMQAAASMLSKLGQLTGDPEALYGGQMTSAQLWLVEQEKRIAAIDDEAERTKQLAELHRVAALEELDARKAAYEAIQGFSDVYWQAEKQRIQNHLDAVKDAATDETAYKIYAGEQWDEYNKKLLEKQERYSSDASTVFASKWALAFDTYKSEATKAHERVATLTGGVVDLAEGAIDAVSGGVGDLVRDFGNGTADINDLFTNMLSRMADEVGAFVETVLKQSLKDGLAQLFGGSTTSGASVTLPTGTTQGGTTSGYDVQSLSQLGKVIGGSTGPSFVDALVQEKRSNVYVGSADGLSDAFQSALDSSRLGYVARVGTTDTGTAAKAAASGTDWSKILGYGSMAALGTAGIVSSASSGNVGGMVGGGLTTLGGLLGVLGTAGMPLAAVPGIGWIAAGTALLGAVASAVFGGSSSSTTKTAEQYRLTVDPRDSFVVTGNTADRYKTTTTGILGSSTSTHTVWGDMPRDVGKALQESIVDSFKTLKAQAATYGFESGYEYASKLNFTGITIDQGQTDAYEANMANVYAFKALSSSGLVGAVNMVQKPYETYTETLERLSAATETVSAVTQAYGFSLSDMAGVTQESIDTMRAYGEAFAGSYAPTWDLMASEMDGMVDVLNNLNWYYDASDADQAAARNVSDEQLRKILVAQWASSVIDAVGEDTYKTVMANVAANTMSTMEAYSRQVTYYTGQANDSIAKLNAAGVTVDNFWDRFAEAMRSGLSVDDFEAWANASTVVDTLGDVTDALDQLEATAANFTTSLEARYYAAIGDDLAAKETQHAADAEYELYQARAAGYDAAILSRMEEVQALELAKIQADYYEEIADNAAAAAKQLASAVADLESRKYAAAGDTPMANWTSLVQQQLEELQDAYTNGYGQDFIDDLVAVQEQDREKSWKEWQLLELQNSLDDLTTEMSKLVNTLSDAMDSMQTVIDAQLSTASSLASDAASVLDALKSTISSVTTGDVSPLTSAEKAASLGGQLDTAYQTMLTAGHGQAAIDAAETISDLASDYLTAAKASMSYEDYLTTYADTVRMLNDAASATGSEYSYYEQISSLLEGEQSILKQLLQELQADDPSIEKINALVASSQAMASSLAGMYADTDAASSWRGTVENLLKQAGFSDADITAALGGPTSTSSFLAQLASFNTSTMPGYINSILALLNDIKDVAAQINSDAPTVAPPSTDIGNQAAQAALASNVRGAMNSQYYAGRSDWTVDEVLANIDTYAQWASAYGVSATQAYTTPSDAASQYYYAAAAAFNRGGALTNTWADWESGVAGLVGSGNIAADYLLRSYRYVSFPTSDAVLSKTVQMVMQLYAAGTFGTGSPYSDARSMASAAGLSWGGDSGASNAGLEAAARSYYDKYGVGMGLIRPYAEGGYAPAGTMALTGEKGWEVGFVGTNTTFVSHSEATGILGSAFRECVNEIAKLREENRMLHSLLTSILYYLRDTSQRMEKWDDTGSLRVQVSA